MKTSILVLSLIICGACQPKNIRKTENIVGDWNIYKFEYFDGKNTQQKSGELGSIIFENIKRLNGQYISNGKQIINNKTYEFQYSFDFDGSQIDIVFPISDRKSMPLEAIGRMQVYNFEMENKSNMIISVPQEYPLQDKTVLYNVKYYLKR